MKLSLIIPCYNEEGNVLPLYRAVNNTFSDTGYDYEFVFVNDGSYDNTADVLKELVNRAERPVRVLNFSRNFGKEAAIYAGLHYATGDYTTIMDGDLQQGPDVVLQMVQYLDAHPECDCVTAFQENRRENPLMVFMKKNFYQIINRLADTEFVSGASDFRTFRSNVKEALLELPERQRFSKGIFSWVGFSTAYLPYTAAERLSGTSKWNFFKLWRYAMTGIVSFTTAPLRLPFYLGAVALGLAVPAAIGGHRQKALRTTAHIWGLGGILLLATGALGTYTGRIFQQTKNRPAYIIQSILDNRHS